MGLGVRTQAAGTVGRCYTGGILDLASGECRFITEYVACVLVKEAGTITLDVDGTAERSNAFRCEVMCS